MMRIEKRGFLDMITEFLIIYCDEIRIGYLLLDYFGSLVSIYYI